MCMCVLLACALAGKLRSRETRLGPGGPWYVIRWSNTCRSAPAGSNCKLLKRDCMPKGQL
jgi:hypothetical protein